MKWLFSKLKRTVSIHPLVCLLFLIQSETLSAKSSPETLAQDIFIKQYINAVNANSSKQFKALQHESYNACVNKNNQDFYQLLQSRELKRTIPSNYKVTFQLLSDEKKQTMLNGAKGRGLPYPVTPTHAVELEYQHHEYDFVSIYRYVIYENNQFLFVGSCPTPEMITRFRNIEKNKAEDKRRAKALYEKMSPALLAELIPLLDKGQKIQAWKLYSQQTGESLSTAKMVLENYNNLSSG